MAEKRAKEEAEMEEEEKRKAAFLKGEKEPSKPAEHYDDDLEL